MAATTAGRDAGTRRMAKHGGKREGAGRRPAGRDERLVRFSRDLADKATFIARDRGQSVAEYLDSVARSRIDRDYAEIARRAIEPPAEGGE
jgi:hypothetical protein